MIRTGQALDFNRPQIDQLFGVDHHRQRIQRYRAAGVAGAAAARNDGQAQLDARTHQWRHFCFRVRRQHDKRIFDAPVGGIGDMRDPRQSVKTDVVLAGVTGQHLERLLAQDSGFLEPALERMHGDFRGGQQARDAIVAVAALVDFMQAMAQRLHQRLAPLAIAQQVVFEIGVAPHHPDIAQHFVEHARRAPGDTLAAQFRQRRPGFRTEQANDDLAIRERGVVVGDFAQAGGHAGHSMELKVLL